MKTFYFGGQGFESIFLFVDRNESKDLFLEVNFLNENIFLSSV